MHTEKERSQKLKLGRGTRVGAMAPDLHTHRLRTRRDAAQLDEVTSGCRYFASVFALRSSEDPKSAA